MLPSMRLSTGRFATVRFLCTRRGGQGRSGGRGAHQERRPADARAPPPPPPQDPPAQQDYNIPRICVIGVGGGGGNALNNMVGHLEGVDFVSANTDSQALSQSLATHRIQLGAGGLGAGADPKKGRQAAEESIEEILKHARDANMVFIAAGMGGGTGTGASPYIAHEISKLNILTVGVVTRPFPFEGSKRMRTAEEGMQLLKDQVDTLLVISNSNLLHQSRGQTTIKEAFRTADSVLLQSVRSITDLIVKPGVINLDFADVKTIMSKAGTGIFGTGEAEGEDRAVTAALDAVRNDLVENTRLNGARGIIVNFTGGDDITMGEISEAMDAIHGEVDNDDCHLIFGTTHDPALTGRVRVSVIATGVDDDSWED